MIYREATLADITSDALLLIRAGLREVELGQEPMSAGRTVATLKRMIEDSSYLVAISEKDGRPTGIIIGSVSDSMFSDSIFATMHVWYVLPEDRGSWTGFRLARIYRDWAKLAGATTAYFDVNSGVDNRMAGGLAQRLGFRHIGDTYKVAL